MINQKDDHNSSKLPEVNQKNTKAELLDAYKYLLQKYEEKIKAKSDKQTQQIIEKEKVKKTEDYTVENITSDLESLKPTMHKVIDDLSGKLVQEAKKNKEIKEAIVVQEKRLQELFDIEAKAETLDALIKTEIAKREELNSAYTKLKIEYKREEEEYNYELNRERKREQAIYQEKQEDFKKREGVLREQEEEMQDLKQKVENFPKELETAIKKTKEETTNEIKKETKVEADLLAKGIEGENKVMLTKLEYAETTIKTQTEQILNLKKELNEATKQVQDIAEKALDSSSGKQTLKAVNEIAMQRSNDNYQQRNERK